VVASACRYAVTPAYTTEVDLVGGGTLKLERRERPQLFFGPDGLPAVLYNAVQPPLGASPGLSFTFAQKLGGGPYPPPPPPGPPGTVCDPTTFMHNMEYDDGAGISPLLLRFQCRTDFAHACLRDLACVLLAPPLSPL
jgi:hypothetical protein